MIADIQEAYRKLHGAGTARVSLPPLARVVVLVTPRAIDDANSVRQEIRALEVYPGWVRTQSAVYRCGEGQKSGPGDGLPLIGEWATSETASVHLRQNSKGGWTLFRYEQQGTLDDARSTLLGNGVVHECLRARISLLAADLPAKAIDPDKLAYDVYWGLENGIMRRRFARFVGFVPSAAQG